MEKGKLKENEMNRILLVDDDSFFHEMSKQILSDFEIHSVFSGEEALEKVESVNPHLILLDIQMDGIDGYETASKLKKIESLTDVPIVFISTLSDTEDKLKAYGVGAIDYISKPFHHEELKNKITQILGLKQKTDEAKQQLNISHQLITDVQRSAAQNQSVSRFAQLSLFCHDVDTLVRLLFLTTTELKVSCILKINSDPVVIHSNNDHMSQLEEEILSLSPHLKRIYGFGKNRAIFNWPDASLLVRNIDNLIDTLALLMDAFEAAYRSIQTQTKLVEKVKKIEYDNEQAKDDIADHFNALRVVLNDFIIQMGFIADLSPQEEDRFNGIVSEYQEKISNNLDVFTQNSKEIRNLLDDLREPPAELVQLLDEKQNKTDEFDDILF